MKPRLLRTGWLIAFILTVYAGTYFCLTLSGGYDLYKTGNIVQFGLPTYDVWLWQPRFGKYDPYFSRRDATGTLFAPLILLDQKFWHPSRPFFERKQDGTLVERPIPDENSLHPAFRRNIKIVLEYAPKMEAARDNHDLKQAELLMNEMTAEMQR